VHGANRLASNSLLEGLVFGALAAEAMAGDEATGNREQGSDDRQGEAGNKTEDGAIDEVGVETWIAELRKLMWRDAGLLRDEAGLLRALADLAALRETQPRGMTRRAQEARNLLAVAEAIVQAALGREESRGAHFRMDFPRRADVARHSVVRRGELRFVE
jgi:L-aspartate oxidase